MEKEIKNKTALYARLIEAKAKVGIYIVNQA